MGNRQTRRLQTVIAAKPGSFSTNVKDYFLMAPDENRKSVSSHVVLLYNIHIIFSLPPILEY